MTHLPPAVHLTSPKKAYKYVEALQACELKYFCLILWLSTAFYQEGIDARQSLDRLLLLVQIAQSLIIDKMILLVWLIACAFCKFE